MVPSPPFLRQQPVYEGKLYVSVSSDISEALTSYIMGTEAFRFDRLGLQSHTDGSSVINLFEGSWTEEETKARKAIFEGGFKFAAYEARKKFNSTASSVKIEEDCSEYPFTQ